MGSSDGVRKRWRRIVAGAGLACLGSVSVASLTASSGAADTPGFNAGQGQALAQAFKLNPTASALSLGFTFGQSLAGYQNTVAKADARGIDLGIVGSLLAAPGCSGGDPTLPADQQPQPLMADSREPGAEKGKTAQEQLNKTPIPIITMAVKATPEPLGQASTDYAAGGQPGAINIAGAHTSAISRVIDGKTREAVAIADIGSLDLGGQVKLTNLHFEAIHRTGAVNEHTGTFTIGSLKIGPQTIPTGDPKPAFDAVNKILNQIGLELRLPAIYAADDRVAVDPMAIAIVPNAARDAISQNVLNAMLPVRQALVDALFQADCHFEDVVTVADIALGSATGSGSFSLEIGGANAQTSELNLSSALSGGGLADVGPTSVAAGSLGAGTETAGLTTPGEPATLGTPGSEGSIGGTGGSTGGAATGAPRVARRIGATSDGSRGGMMTAVAAVGFGLLLAAVEGDRRMMRRAQRMIPPEA